MISRITNYTLKATFHQVQDIGVERYSSPFFFEPSYGATIPTVLKEGIDDASEDVGETFVYGDWLLDKIKEAFGEYKYLTRTKVSAPA